MEALYIEGHQQGPQLDIGDAGVQTGPLPAGVYKVYTPVDIRVKIDPDNAADVTRTSGDIVLKGNTEKYHVPEGSRIGVVAARDGLTGKFEYHLVGRSF
ncbi:MAG: hypothetical protein HRU77_04025 [Gammaproteobacteria bacterium]|nr:MAG: hypothetical protein HRU77_04025 [Gammaproteobacteria bacterium]